MKAFAVAKFGGTSMGTAAAMKKAAEIVSARKATRIVVVSATSGTTNSLLKIFESKKVGHLAVVKEEAEAICTRHLELAFALGCEERTASLLGALFQEIQTFVKNPMRPDALQLDALLSLGERLSSVLFTEALRAEGVDAELIDSRDFLKTDSHFGKAESDPGEMKIRCSSLGEKVKNLDLVLVTQGFIGSDSSNRTTTLGRGGSDYSAALFAEALGAHDLEIWTDVPGMLTMDPRVVPEARIIPELSFSEAAEMANFGAKVLHPVTLWPAIRSSIPVFVGSTFHPEREGTRILSRIQGEAPLIRAIAVRHHQTLITVSSLRMLNAYGFLAKIFEVLARHHLSVDLVTTSEVSVALTIDNTASGSSGKRIQEQVDMLEELRAFADVRLEENLSLIAVIGNSLDIASGVAATVFQAIREFNIRLICHGASEHNICFLVASREASEIARRLHSVCITQTDQ